jgi:hypothetical protein
MRWFARKLAWRLGRKLYCWARGDLANDRERNGEYWLLERVLSAAPEAGVFMDVGANKGDWTLRALSLADATRKRITVYAFEPSSATRSMLSARLPSTPNVEVLPFALSSVVGRAEFFSNGAGSGTNSLSAHPASCPRRSS